LNMFNNHLSYITNFEMFGKKYKCRNCSKLHTKLYQMRRHEKTCKDATTVQYPGGFYTSPPTLFELLEELGYKISEEDRYYKYFIPFKSITQYFWNVPYRRYIVNSCIYTRYQN
jgi:hypothetical protein